MSSRSPQLEVLISRYLDGEISAREMEDMRAMVDSDDQAKDLFDQMVRLHRCCQDAIQTRVIQQGRPMEDLIASAWEGHQSHIWLGRIRRVVSSQFVSGLAAGLVVALLVHLAVTSQRSTPPTPSGSEAAGVPSAVTTAATDEGLTGRTTELTEAVPKQDAVGQVDYYTFTDRQGNHWVIEGLSEERVQAVGYRDF